MSPRTIERFDTRLGDTCNVCGKHATRAVRLGDQSVYLCALHAVLAAALLAPSRSAAIIRMLATDLSLPTEPAVWCERCDGQGENVTTCPDCKGSGFVPMTRRRK